VTNYNQTLADINALDVTELGTVTSGNLSNTAIVYPAGHVLQVLTTVDDGASSTSDESQWHTVHTISITNVLSGSIIHIMAAIGGALTETGGQVGYRIIDSVGGNLAQGQSTTGGNSSWHGVLPTLMGKDTSPLVGTNTYSIQYRPSASPEAYYNYEAGSGMYTRSFYQIMEVVG